MVLILLVAVSHAPWWFGSLLALGAIWRLGGGYELLFPIAVADMAYGTPFPGLFNFAFPATLLTAMIVVLGRIAAKQFFFRS